jgi:imidazolonepropionase-like amidohydrolase
MRRLLLLAILAIAVPLRGDRILFRNATVIDGTGAEARAHLDVLVDGDLIAAIRPAGTIARGGARVIDCRGKYLLPGFVDMHAHVLAHPWDVHGNLLPQIDRQAVAEMLRLFLRFGITTVRDPGAETEAAVALRNSKYEGPAIITAGRILNDSNFDAPPFIPVHDANQVRSEIARQAAAGVDLVKLYSSMPPELVKVAIEEAHAHHLPVIGHLQRTTWTEAAELGIDGVEHAAPWSPQYVEAGARDQYEPTLFGRVFWLEHLDASAIDAMVKALVEQRVVVDPTLMATATKFDPRWQADPDLALAPAAFAQGWPAGSFTSRWTPRQYEEAHKTWPIVLRLTKKLFDAGVLMVAGTDTPTPWIVPGASLHHELKLLVDCGIPPGDVIAMATGNAARALRRENDFGTIREGLRADLVLLDRNPLRDIRNTRAIRLVVQRGRVVMPAGRSASPAP